MGLHIGISILSKTDVPYELLCYSREILEWFVIESIELYGNTFQSYNVHSLVHLCDDVIRFQLPLDALSAFKFENYLKTLKRFVRNANNPLAQIVKRIKEIESTGSVSKKELQWKIRSNGKDAWFLIHTQIVHVISVDNETCNCEVFYKADLLELFTEPCESKCVDIFVVKKNTKKKRRRFSINDFTQKFVCIPIENEAFVLILMKSRHNTN